jgi:hypothetical protein
VASAGFLYQHETGLTDNGATRVGSIYAESGALELAGGERVVDVLQVLPDERTRGDVSITFRTRFTPMGEEYDYGPYTVRADGYTDVRASGRQAKVRFAPVNDSDWQIGTYRADVKVAGER